jgi:hypothetical protein
MSIGVGLRGLDLIEINRPGRAHRPLPAGLSLLLD